MEKRIPCRIAFLALSLLLSFGLAAQNAPIVLELEDGIVGTDFEVTSTSGETFVSITTNGVGDNPESADRVISLGVTFPFAQQYDIYVRCRIGGAGANDDSFFYASDFGTPSVSDNDAWTRVNNVFNLGHNTGNAIVDGAGATGTGVWKWINLSEYGGDEPPVIFTVSEDNFSTTFQIGAREDGIDLDKIAFARADYFFTVDNLDNGEDGSPTAVSGPGTLPIAEGQPKFLGCAYSGSQALYFENYWNQITPENAGKWGSVEATRDVMNWTVLDEAYELAQANDFTFKSHVLIWGNQQPSWIENLPPAEQLEEIEEWFAAVAERYPDMEIIEVVNEPLHDPPNQAGSGGGNYINALGGTGASGWEWVLESFRLAREYFPNTQLMLNDYNIVNSASNVNEYLEIIELLQGENLIDQIGVQAHAFSTVNASVSQITANLDALAETGLPIYVTELDIDGPTDGTQLAEYQRVFPVFWEHPAVQGITMWGFRPGMWRTDQGAFLIENDGVTERPAMEWLREYVSGVSNTFEPGYADHISLFPNPATKGTAVAVRGLEGITQVEVFDAAGRLVWAGLPEQEQAFHLPESCRAGMYWIRLRADQRSYTKKLLFFDH